MENYEKKRIEFEGIQYFPRLEYKDPSEIAPRDLPMGQISIDKPATLTGLLNELSAEFNIQPSKFPLEFLEPIQNLSLIVPDVSQMVDNIIQLGNTGHKVLIETNSEAQTDRALEELYLFSKSAFADYGGLDGFVNGILAQAARTGAMSVEWVIKKDLSGIEKVVMVPVSTIKFVFDPELGRNVPYQKVSTLGFNTGTMVRLNTNTYQYCGMNLLDNSPYAIPPILAALESVMISRDVIKNFKFVAKKFGLLGFVTFLMSAPKSIAGESNSAYQSRCESFLTTQAEKIKYNYRDGIAVGFKDNLTVEHHSVMGAADGAEKIHQAIEQQVISGLKSDPALHGRTYSTTETYAGVVYEKLLAMLTNYHRIAKSILEYGYKLQLMLTGLDYNELTIEFEPSKSLASERDETIYGQKLTNLQLLYSQGIISQEQFAQEAGYDSPELPEPRAIDFFAPQPDNTDQAQQVYKKELIFNKKTLQYRKPINNKDLIIVEETEDLESIFQKLQGLEQCCENHSIESLAQETPSIKRLRKFMLEYFRKVYPNVKSSRIFAVNAVDKILKSTKNLESLDSEQFAELVLNELSGSFNSKLASGPIADNVRRSLSRIYSYYRLSDTEPFGKDFPVKPSFNVVDRRAIQFMRDSDEFYFGKYIDDADTKKSLKKWLEKEYLTSGRSIRDPGELENFRKKFGERVAKEDFKVLRVVETSASRAKNWGNALTAEQAQVHSIRIAGPVDNVSCKWCEAMTKKVFKLNNVIDNIKSTIDRSPEDLPQLNPFLPGKYHPSILQDTSSEQLLAQGIALPPYHPHCRHRFVVEEFNE